MAVVLEHIGGGDLRPVKASQRKEIVERYKVGDRLAGELGQPRSRQQNKALHAAIAKAFANVPESSPHQFEDAEHLRHWCFIRVGFKDIVLHRFTDGMTPKDVKLMTDALMEQRRIYKEKGIYTEIRAVPEGLAWDIPKSWAFKRAKHRAATAVMDAVLDQLVELVPGITREQLVEAVHKDAA